VAEGKPLVIVESPAKARTIAGFLGKGFDVMASIGHIRDLPRSADEVPAKFKGTDAGKLGIDVDNSFAPIYVVPSEKRKVVAELKRAVAVASELYLATDEDREGEAISWHVCEVLKPKIPVKRMVFHEITHDAIAAALENWRDLDANLVEAQEGRRVLDRLVGYEISPVLWKKIMPRLSAGRVQSVATRLVVERERLRMAFRKADYWDIEGQFAAHGEGFPARLTALDGNRIASSRDFDPSTGKLIQKSESESERGKPVVLLDQAKAEGLAERLTGKPFSVASVEAKEFQERPKAPFITSTLQQEAGRKLRFSSSRTMQLAQRLYENGFITYMRTDSTNLSTQAIEGARAEILERYGREYLPDAPRSYQKKVKNAQEAHEAIRPAGDRFRNPEDVKAQLSVDEHKIYDLIWKRTIASQMENARAKRVSVLLTATSSSGEAVTFTASGKTYTFVGFRMAYVEGADDPDAELEDQETRLPNVAEGEKADCKKLDPTGHTTQPPARFTEASLVKELEDRGIGRPSTYASVIQTIQNRGYVWKKGSALVPSWTGFAVVQLLERHFDYLVDYGFTARMEEDLDAIARHETESQAWLRLFYFGNGNGHSGLRHLVAEDHLNEIDKREVNKIVVLNDEKDREIYIRVWGNGASLHRGEEEKAPVPDGIAPDELTIEVAEELFRRASAGPQVLGHDPETGLPVIARDGRYGPFVQLGELEEGSKSKPKTASLFQSMSLDTITIEQALRLLTLPRVVGKDADGVEITAQNGRYGPYLRKDTDSRSLESEEQIFTVTVEQANAIFAQPKRRGRQAKPPLAELGNHPESGAPVRILDGRFGPYVTDGTTNASVPRGTDPANLTMDEAVTLLAERAARGPSKARTKKTAAKKSAKKAATKKTAAKKKTAKKTAAKKTAKKTRAKAAKKSKSE
jgi:DNA topoisomerase-1